MTEKRLLSLEDYRNLYGPGRSKTYELISEGQLEKVKIGSRTFITPESAEAHRQRVIDQARSDAA